jgi:hypothetical protein
MKFKLEFNCDNSAFEPLEPEIARLLQTEES